MLLFKGNRQRMNELFEELKKTNSTVKQLEMEMAFLQEKVLKRIKPKMPKEEEETDEENPDMTAIIKAFGGETPIEFQQRKV
jgi:hypothetical protein